MIYNYLPKTDLNVSKICLGTMTFGEQNNEAEAHQQINYALDQGVNILDTAELYAVPSNPENNGLTEKFIGSWISQGNNRSKIHLATKVTGPSRGLSYVRDDLSYNNNSIRKALEGSLTRLKTDYIDIYQLHWPERRANFFSKRTFIYDEKDPWQENFEEIVEIFNTLIKEGKIRYWGISNETAWGVMKYLNTSDQLQLKRCITVQNPYNLLNRQYEIGLSEINMREDIRLLSYSPMAFGLLSGKYHNGIDKDSDRLNKYTQMARYSGKRTYEAVGKYLELANEYNISLAKLSLAYINRQPFVGCNIIGATNMEQLKENISSIDVKLDDDLILKLNQIFEEYPDPAP